MVNDKWSGSGKIAVSGGDANFGFKVRRTNAGIKGSLTYTNNTNGFTFNATGMFTLTVTGNQAVFTGTGLESSNGGPTSGPFNFTVTVKDFGASGDTFKIEISDTGGTVAGSTTSPLIRGNIQQYY